MKTIVFLFLFICCILKPISCFKLVLRNSQEQDGGVTEFPSAQTELAHAKHEKDRGLTEYPFAQTESFKLHAKHEQDGGVTEFPFAQAKVKYHRSRYCITAFGQTTCVRMEEEPGNAAKLAKLYKIVMQGYQQDVALRTGQNSKPSIRSSDAILNQDIALNQLIKPLRSEYANLLSLLGIKPKTNEDKPKFSKWIKPMFTGLPKKMSQDAKLMSETYIKPKTNQDRPKFTYRIKPMFTGLPKKMSQDANLVSKTYIKPKTNQDQQKFTKWIKPMFRELPKKTNQDANLSKLDIKPKTNQDKPKFSTCLKYIFNTFRAKGLPEKVSQDANLRSKLDVKPITNQDKPNFSKLTNPFFRELSKKMSQKLSLQKYITQKPYHVAPIPRRSGLSDRSPYLNLNFNPLRRVGVVGTYPQQRK